MGDVAMTVPVVHALAMTYPHLRITVLSKPFARTLFENLAPNVGFMEVSAEEMRNIRGLNALYRRLIAKKFTAVADLHDVLRSKFLRLRFNLGGFKTAHIDKHRKGKRLLVSRKRKQLVQQPTSFSNYAAVLEQLGYPVNVSFTSIFGSGRGDFRLLADRMAPKAAGERWIGVAPFAAHKGKIYPIDMMEQVIAGLTARHPSYRVFLFGGGKAEQTVLDRIAATNVRCVNASAMLTGLDQELILMSHLDVMVSMDSANMHLASLTATPVVSVWGATHPYAGFMGWNQPADNAVQTSLPCRPCSIYGNRPCLRGDYACLCSIRPEEIIQKVESIVD